MAGRASRIDQEQQRIGVTIHAQFDHAHDIAGSRTFVPQFAATATPEVRLARLDSQVERVGVHPGYHQHAISLRVLDDSSDQAMIVPFERVG